MTLNLQEQGTIVEERGKELFWDHIGQLLFLLSHFLEVSDVSEVSVSLKPKNVFMIGILMLFTTLYIFTF